MKHLIVFSLTFFFILTNCQNDDNNSDNTDILNGQWNLINISGGIAGNNIDFENRLIFWSFNSENSTLTITNNNSDSTINDGLDSGTYSYSIQNSNGKSFLFINNSEFGNITVLDGELLINQNIFTNANGADGFILKLNKIFPGEPF